MKIIEDSPALRITNLDQLSRGTGARYLEVVEPHRDGLPLVAARWRRSLPGSLPRGRAVVVFTPVRAAVADILGVQS